MSGGGARIQGGRWNPPNSFSVLYLALERETVVAEFLRFLGRQSLAPEKIWPRAMYSYELVLDPVLDLTSPEAVELVGLRESDLSADDLEPCQSVGEAAFACGRRGVLAPSATGTGTVLAVYMDNRGSDDVVKAGDYVLWDSVAQMP